MLLKYQVIYTHFLANVRTCVSALSEVSSAGRNSHPVRSKQRPLVLLHAEVWVIGRLSRQRGSQETPKKTLLCPDMTVNWAQGFWVSGPPHPHTKLTSQGPNEDVKTQPRRCYHKRDVIKTSLTKFQRLLSHVFCLTNFTCNLIMQWIKCNLYAI